MSKENLSSKSSINTPEEGIKNAAEDNKLKSSINTPERVELLEAAQTKASEPSQENGNRKISQQEKERCKRIRHFTVLELFVPESLQVE
ncbi:hypothetical protein [Rickettsia slovaca]|uniref:Uncharacterized protein n=2 Tax=Rickettsia slovaca TaxID=35794 RepID=H8LPJ3_RICSL|nr:hypothetical protein [Rickettsia slovaca]AEV92412.1 hypothetical protein Rsl_976 [Rickettsia slovaca 13-B]AFD19858.1 hypothetical protein MC3_04740 [Rickettsia slovaca str. D-CWPP]